jgi:flagella basal body P-ring formation protein FlgA
MTVLLSILLFFNAGLTPVQPERIKRAVEEYVAGRWNTRSEEYQIEFRAISSTITVSSPAYSVQIGVGSVPKLKGLVGIPVEIVCNGKVERSIVVPARIRTFANAMVANRQLQRHEVIAPDAMTAQRIETTGLAEDVVFQGMPFVGMRTVRIVSANAVLCRSMVERTPVVKPEDVVTISVRSGKTKVTVQGVAKQEGCVGDVIAVQRPGSIERLRAIVVDAHTVQLEMGQIFPDRQDN